MNDMEKQFCDQCENQCPIEELRCGKGRKHFGLEAAENGKEKRGHHMPQDSLGLLMKCGHFLHHGGADGEDLLLALSPAEQVELERMLMTLLEDWKNSIPCGGHDQGRHGR